jgi:phospholipid/cholesterol/gamma-HCH transport system substrate-binding protein
MIQRDRVTDRVSASTLKLELKRAIRPLIASLIGLAVAVAAGEYMLSHINGGIGSTHTMHFEVADATGVVPGRAEVRFYGIAAGIISDARLQNGHSVLTATVADKFGPVYRNAVAELRPNTALQDMYLDIVNRGTPSAGVAPDGYVIPLDQTTSPTNLADVLNTFQPDVRAQLYNLVDQLGNGLAGHGQDLRHAFALLAPFLHIAGNIGQQLAIRAQDTKQLIHTAASLSGVLASRSTQLRTTITNGTTALEALATEGGSALRQTIGGFPPALRNAQAIMTAINGIEPNLTSALTNLTPVANELPSGLNNLKALADSANPAVSKLQTPVANLVPLAQQLRPLSSALAATMRQLSPQTGDLNQITTPAANCITQIDEFINWDASMGKWYDSRGHFTRGNANFGFYSAPVGGLPNEHFDYGTQCSGATPLGGVPTPKLNGPPPAP